MPRDPSSFRAIRARPERTTVASAMVFRVVLLGVGAVIGAIWGLVHFYTHVPPKMLVPVPVPSASSDWPGDAGLIPAPEIDVAPAR